MNGWISKEFGRKLSRQYPEIHLESESRIIKTLIQQSW